MGLENKSTALLQELVTVIQDLFILQALEAGITAENVRALVGVDRARVSRVSKARNKAKT
jgi:hypothetical protein